LTGWIKRRLVLMRSVCSVKYLPAACSALACLVSFGLRWDRVGAAGDKKDVETRAEKEPDGLSVAGGSAMEGKQTPKSGDNVTVLSL
jgi:hypothetical protein